MEEESKVECLHTALTYSKEFRTVRCEGCQRVWRDEWERPINIVMQAPPQPMAYPNIPIIGAPR
jgi:hypothetical protein